MRTYLFLTAFLLSSWAQAGLPPTTTKGSGDSSPVTTFEIDWPSVTLTHVGTKASIPTLPNAALTNSSMTLAGHAISLGGTQTFAASDLTNGTTGSGAVCLASAPNLTNPVVGTQSQGDNSTKAASTAYVDTSLAQLNPKAAVYAASTANIAGTYLNAVGGICIGDTFTVTATGALSMDGVSPPVGSRVLLKNQTSAFQNGVWDVTVAGTTGISPVLTRSLDYDSAVDMNSGQIIPVINGTVNASTSWVQTATISTCSSDSQSYTQFTKSPSSYASSTLTSAHFYVGNGSNVATDTAMSGDCSLSNAGALTCTKTNGTSFGTLATQTSSGVSAGTYTLATVTVNAQGVVTSASSGTVSSNLARQTCTTSCTMSDSTDILICNSASAITVTLPTTATASTKMRYVKNRNTGTCTLSSADNIDGQTTLGISAQYGGVQVSTDNTTWDSF